MYLSELGHSDPAKLKDTAQDVKRLSPSEIKKRQEEIKVRLLSISETVSASKFIIEMNILYCYTFVNFIILIKCFQSRSMYIYIYVIPFWYSL